MTTSTDLVEVEVPAEQVRADDHLDGVRVVRVDVTDQQVTAVLVDGAATLPRGHLVRVTRPASAGTPGQPAPAIDPTEFAAVRDLALSLADAASTGKATEPVRKAADRVRKAKP